MDSMDGALIDSQIVSESIVVDKLLKQFKGHENLKRVEAFDALAGERKYQGTLSPGSPQTVANELILLHQYVSKAMAVYTATFNDPEEKPTMEIIRKIGAICLRCMENHGSIKRENKS